MAISGHCREASLRNHIDCPSSEQPRVFPDIFSDALSGRPHQSQQPSFTAISYRAIFMFLWIRLSFIHKTHALSSLCSSRQVENSWVFISFNSAGFRWTFHFQILYLRQNLQENVSNSTCRTISVCKQLQIVNLMVCRLWWFEIFDSLSFVQPVRLFEPSYQGFWLAYCSVLSKNIRI